MGHLDPGFDRLAEILRAGAGPSSELVIHALLSLDPEKVRQALSILK